MSWYIWAELQHISWRNFITILGAQWVGMTVNHWKLFFFCSAQSWKWWLLFESWLPLLQGQWRVQFCLVALLFRLSFTVKGLISESFFPSTDTTNPSQQKHNKLTRIDVCKINSHARKIAHFFPGKRKRLYRTAKTANSRKHMRLCSCISVPVHSIKYIEYNYKYLTERQADDLNYDYTDPKMTLNSEKIQHLNIYSGH